MKGGGKRFWIILGLIFVIWLGVLKLALAAYVAAQANQGATEESVIHPVFPARVAKQTNVDKLAKAGDEFIKQKKYFYASHVLKRASDLDSHYRDVAYGWAYATMQVHQEKLTPEILAEVKTGLTRAEKIDPFYEPMLRLKLLIAELEQNQEAQSQIQARLTTLGLK